MKFRIKAKPVFGFSLTPDEVSVLITCSTRHYDATCRRASKPATGIIPVSGFLQNWRAFMVASVDFPPGEEFDPIVASWQEIDLALKILENRVGLSQHEVKTARELTVAFTELLGFTTLFAQAWKTTFINRPAVDPYERIFGISFPEDQPCQQ